MILIRSLGDVPEGDPRRQRSMGIQSRGQSSALRVSPSVFCNVDIAVVIGINKVFLISHSSPRQNGSRLERGRRASFGHQTGQQALKETEEGSDS